MYRSLGLFILLFSLTNSLSSFSQEPLPNQEKAPSQAEAPSPQTSIDLQAIPQKLIKALESIKLPIDLENGEADLFALLAAEPVQKAMKVATNPKVLESVTEVAKRINYKRLIIAQIILLLFMVTFSSWLQGLANNWLQRLIASFTSFALYAFGAMVVAPYSAIGKPYLRLIYYLFGAINDL